MPIEVVGAVFGLALLDTLSPAVIGVTSYVLLAGPRRPGVPLGVYLGSVAAAYFCLGVLLMLGFGALLPHLGDTVLTWAQVIFGAALVVGSYFIPDRDPQRGVLGPPSLTPRTMLLLGATTFLIEFATALPYFGAIGIMTAARLPAVEWLPLLAGYVLVMVLPGLVLFTAWTALEERLRARFERWRDRFTSGSRETLRWIVGIAGVLILLEAAPDQITITLGR